MRCQYVIKTSVCSVVKNMIKDSYLKYSAFEHRETVKSLLVQPSKYEALFKDPVRTAQ